MSVIYLHPGRPFIVVRKLPQFAFYSVVLRRLTLTFGACRKCAAIWINLSANLQYTRNLHKCGYLSGGRQTCPWACNKRQGMVLTDDNRLRCSLYYDLLMTRLLEEVVRPYCTHLFIWFYVSEVRPSFPVDCISMTRLSDNQTDLETQFTSF